MSSDWNYWIWIVCPAKQSIFFSLKIFIKVKFISKILFKGKKVGVGGDQNIPATHQLKNAALMFCLFSVSMSTLNQWFLLLHSKTDQALFFKSFFLNILLLCKLFWIILRGQGITNRVLKKAAAGLFSCYYSVGCLDFKKNKPCPPLSTLPQTLKQWPGDRDQPPGRQH